MGIKKGLTIGKARGALYKSARVLGDVNSVVRGTVPQRIFNRVIGSMFTQIMRAISSVFFGRR